MSLTLKGLEPVCSWLPPLEPWATTPATDSTARVSTTAAAKQRPLHVLHSFLQVDYMSSNASYIPWSSEKLMSVNFPLMGIYYVMQPEVVSPFLP